MSNVVYYYAGSKKAPGVRVSLAAAVNEDDGGHRARLKQKVLHDEHFLRFVCVFVFGFGFVFRHCDYLCW